LFCILGNTLKFKSDVILASGEDILFFGVYVMQNDNNFESFH